MLYRITTPEKSERFDLLPYDFIETGIQRDIFLPILKWFSHKLFHKTAPNHWLQKVFICLECQIIMVFVELRKKKCRNGRNVATVLRAMVKSHNRLKGTEVFVCGFSGRNLRLFKFCWEEPVLGSFFMKLQHVMCYKRLLGQLYQKRDVYLETQILKKIWTRLLTFLLDCLWNNVK